MLNIELRHAESLDDAWTQAKDVADKFFSGREYRLRYVGAESVGAEAINSVLYNVTFHAAEQNTYPYVSNDPIRLVG